MSASKTVETATPTTRVIYLGTVTRDNPDETFAVDINADPADIIAAIEQAEEQKRVAAAEESRRLAELFHPPDASKKAGLS